MLYKVVYNDYKLNTLLPPLNLEQKRMGLQKNYKSFVLMQTKFVSFPFIVCGIYSVILGRNNLNYTVYFSIGN